MAKVAREMVEKAGVDVDKLLKLLVDNAAAELTTFYYYTILRVNLIGLEDFHDTSACPPAKLPKDPTDIKAMLKVLVEAERCAVRGYTAVCNLTAGKDHRTYALAQAILHEEVEHESWFSEFLGEGPSGHYLRQGETSPFVGPFMR
jgi:ferritin-like protein